MLYGNSMEPYDKLISISNFVRLYSKPKAV
jgi:hypothetical protein